jgi:hypothetical protein
MTSQQLHHHTLSFLMSYPTPIKLTPFYAWKMAQIIIPLFYLPLAIFSIAFWIKSKLRHPPIVSLPHCVYNDPINPIHIHLLLFTITMSIPRHKCISQFCFHHLWNQFPHASQTPWTLAQTSLFHLSNLMPTSCPKT